MFVCARDIVARTSDFDVLSQNMTLRPWQWEMLHAFDDRTSLGAIARRIGVDLGSITDSLSALEQHGLIKIRTVTREEFRRVFELQPPSSAPRPRDDDDEVEAPRPRLSIEPARSKPAPNSTEPLSVRLEQLRAKAEQAQQQRPPSADTVPFLAQAATPEVIAPPAQVPTVPPPAAWQNPAADTTVAATLAAFAEPVAAAEPAVAPAPPDHHVEEEPQAADVPAFDAKLADLHAEIAEQQAETLAPPVPAPPKPDAFAAFAEALSARTEEPPPVLEVPERAYVGTNGNSNGNGHASVHTAIAFSLAAEPAPRATLSPDAIEFTVDRGLNVIDPPSQPDAEPPKKPLQY
jgi:hypothetical protein